MTTAVAKPFAATANLRGLFAGDWAIDEKITLLAETFTVFSSLQKIAAEQEQSRHRGALPSSSLRGGSKNSTLLFPAVQTLQYYHRITNLYREAFRRYIQTLEASDKEDDTPDLEVAQSIHTILHFVETLYIPSDGRGSGVVGEEILHWLNSFDYAPRTEDGQEIAQSAVPYEHASYWDYILRCVLRGFHSSAASLLSSLASSHSSPTLRRVSKRVCELLSSMPRSTGFSMEHDFVAAHRRWVAQVRSLLNKLEPEMDEMEAELGQGAANHEDVEDERLEFEAQFRCLLELMIGVKERVFEACDDWREALGAWGVLVQPALKRDDVPEIIQAILAAFPIDTTLISEAILAALAQGNVVKACKLAQEYDPWLAAHMTDLLDRVGILDEALETTSDANDQFDTVRVRYIQQYAETVLDDQGLWRLAVDYLSYCGPAGRRRMRYILLDVPLTGPDVQPSRLDVKRVTDLEAEAEDAEMDEDADDPEQAAEERRKRQEAEREARRVAQEFNVTVEIIQTCVELGMQQEARAVCKRMATEMAKQRRMGAALAYCVRAHDVRQIKRIADDVVRMYIDDGAEAFCAAVDSIPSTLLDRAADRADAADDDQRALPNGDPYDRLNELGPLHDGGSASVLYSSRLVFLARYRDFHRLCSEGAVRPAAVALVDIVTSNVAPEPFRAVLLVDAIPFLHGEQGALRAEESYELLRVLDSIATASQGHPRQAYYHLGMLERLLSPSAAPNAKVNDQQKSLADVEDDVVDEEDDDRIAASFNGRAATRRLDILRLALARHLARSVALQGTTEQAS